MPGLERETLLTDCRRFIPAFDGLLIRISPQLWGNSVAINFILHICIMLSQYTVSCSAEHRVHMQQFHTFAEKKTNTQSDDVFSIL